MIPVFAESGFFARKFLEMSLRGFRAALLQALAQGMMTLARLLNGLPAKGFALTIGCQIDDAQINAQDTRRLVWFRSRNIQRDRQKELPLAIEQVGLSFDAVQTGLLIAANAEGDKYAALQCQERDSQQALEAHDSLIVDHRAFWLEGGLHALVTLVGFTGLANRTDRQLRRQFVRPAQVTIDLALQFKLIGGLFSTGDLCHIITRGIKGVHRVKQGAVLFWRWDKLQEHRLFHGLSVAGIERVVSSFSPLRGVQFLPWLKPRGILARSL